jgi:phospholipid N-methyltransferase
LPYSSNAFDHYVSTVIGLLQPQTVCDIGPGAGKYVDIVRKAAELHGFAARITAVEIDEAYVEQYDLRSRHDEVILGDALDLINSPKVRFDLVIIGDCIEHMRKSNGVDLLNFLMYRAGYICVIYPEAYIQDDWDGHAAEAHISTWGPADFSDWKTLHHSWDGAHLFLIKGYQPSRLTITG